MVAHFYMYYDHPTIITVQLQCSYTDQLLGNLSLTTKYSQCHSTPKNDRPTVKVFIIHLYYHSIHFLKMCISFIE